MQEPYRKGVANHPDPQSCAGGREVAGEALARVHVGQPLSSEITTPARRPSPVRGKATPGDPLCEGLLGAAESETLSMRGNLMRENRETRVPPTTPAGVVGRSEKASRPTSDMHGARESDDLIVPAKRANNAGPKAAAESVEGRGSTKGNVFAVGRVPDTAPDWRVVRREGVRQAA